MKTTEEKREYRNEEVEALILDAIYNSDDDSTQIFKEELVKLSRKDT